MHPIDDVVSLIAQERWGTFGDAHAKAAGASRQFIASRLKDERWVRFAEGSLGFPQWPPSFERSLWAALHAGHHHAGVGPFAGAAVYGFKSFPRNRLDLLVPHGTTHRNPIALVVQTRHMPTLVSFNGFPIASRERVLCDVARRVDPKRLGVALDDQLVKGLVSLPRLQRTFLALAVPGWPGLRVMSAVLAERGQEFVPPKSDLERGLRLVVASIPGLIVSFEKQIGDPVEMPHQVDCVVEEPRKLILETDGRTWHQRIKEMANDRRRDRRAAALGYPTFRYLYNEVMYERDVVRKEIADYLFAGG